jgi:hypothetical protein
VEGYGLKSETSGFFKGYDINVNPGIMNSAATAALQFFTSLMPEKISMFAEASPNVPP